VEYRFASRKRVKSKAWSLIDRLQERWNLTDDAGYGCLELVDDRGDRCGAGAIDRGAAV
jgi:hypothetical protein